MARYGPTPRLRGHAARGTGLINNELYIGKLVWNRLRYIKDPTTGKRVSRINPREKWITTEVPELRIVDDELVAGREGAPRRACVEVRQRHHRDPRRARQPLERHAPAALAAFRACWSAAAAAGPMPCAARTAIACSNHVMNGSCANSRTIAREALEARVLDGLRDRLMAPEIAAEAMRAYAEETNRLNRERRSSGDADRQDARRCREES